MLAHGTTLIETGIAQNSIATAPVRTNFTEALRIAHPPYESSLPAPTLISRPASELDLDQKGKSDEQS